MTPAPLLAALLHVWASLYADLSLGAAVETNLNHAASSGERQAAGLLDVALVGGIEQEQGTLDYWIEAGYDLTYYPAFGDFTSHAGTLALGGSLQLPYALSVRLSPFVSGLAYGDSARDSILAGGTVSLRWRPLDVLHASLRFNPSVRVARDDVFDATVMRGGAFVGVLPWHWLDLALGYTLESSDVVLYSNVVTSMSTPRGRGRRVTSFGLGEIASRQHASIHGLHASAIAQLPLGIYVAAGYTGSWVELGTQSYVDHLLAARVGVML